MPSPGLGCGGRVASPRARSSARSCHPGCVQRRQHFRVRLRSTGAASWAPGRGRPCRRRRSSAPPRTHHSAGAGCRTASWATAPGSERCGPRAGQASPKYRPQPPGERSGGGLDSPCTVCGHPMEAERLQERVLIVDDDPSFRTYLDLRLQRESASTYQAESAEAALEALEAFGPTVMIVDVVLPGMSGLDLVRRLRGDGVHRRLPILILTGADHSAEVGDVVGLGLAWYLRKDAAWPLVQRTLRNLTARAREATLV